MSTLTTYRADASMIFHFVDASRAPLQRRTHLVNFNQLFSTSAIALGLMADFVDS